MRALPVLIRKDPMRGIPNPFRKSLHEGRAAHYVALQPMLLYTSAAPLRESWRQPVLGEEFWLNSTLLLCNLILWERMKQINIHFKNIRQLCSI